MKNSNIDKNPNSFASYFENTNFKIDSLKPGEQIETQIVSISNDCIFLQLSGKSEGILDRAELANEEGTLKVKIGDTIKAFFLNEKNGEKYFTTRISSDKAGPEILLNAYRNKIPVEGIVTKEIKGGYEIKIGEVNAFCPYSQMGLNRSESSESYIGKHITFQIQEYKENKGNILVSNRVIQEEIHKDKIELLKTTLREDSIVKGVIKSLQDFGAFVDINGIQALLPISEISRDRIEDIHLALTVGQQIEAIVLKIDWQNERITLSMKSLLSDPWLNVLEKYKIDSKHSGKIVRITNFGAFVSLESGIDGLVHISTNQDSRRNSSNEAQLKIGQTIKVQVLDIDIEKKRIALKQVSSFEEDEISKKYLEDTTDSDTYNPFAALLNKKK